MKMFDKYGNGLTIGLLLLACFIIYYYYSYIQGKSIGGVELLSSDMNTAYSNSSVSGGMGVGSGAPSPNTEVNTGNFAPVNGIQSSIIQPSGQCNSTAIQNPAELLPHVQKDPKWAVLSPSGEGELANINLLQAGYHAGIDTIGSSLRNANLQVRSEPPNPIITNVSPWNISTITPDTGRPALEIGNGPL
jgi:hypothetical protein